MKKWRLLLPILSLVACTLYLRSLASWRPMQVFATKERIAQFVFSSDGKTLLVMSTSSLWSALTKAPVAIVALDANREFQPLWQRRESLFNGGGAQFFDRDSRLLLQGVNIRVLDSWTGKESLRYGLMGNAAMSPNGQWLAYHRFSDGRVYINPRRNQDPYETIRAAQTLGQAPQYSTALAFSPDGKTLAVGVSDNNGPHIDLYSTKTWKRTRTFTERRLISLRQQNDEGRALYESIEWSGDSQLLLSCWFDEGQTGTRLRRGNDGKVLAERDLTNTTAELQNDGHIVGFSAGGQIFFRKDRDLNSRGKLLLYLPNESITAATLSPDGGYLIAGTESGKVFRKRVK